jgi:hypothetical protein
MNSLKHHEALLAALPPASKVSASSRGAGAFLSVSLTFEPDLTLGLRHECRPPPGGLCSHEGCAAEMTAVHVQPCTKQGNADYKHNALRDKVSEACKIALCLQGVRTDNNTASALKAFSGKRMDVYVPGQQLKVLLFNDYRQTRPGYGQVQQCSSVRCVSGRRDMHHECTPQCSQHRATQQQREQRKNSNI